MGTTFDIQQWYNEQPEDTKNEAQHVYVFLKRLGITKIYKEQVEKLCELFLSAKKGEVNG